MSKKINLDAVKAETVTVEIEGKEYDVKNPLEFTWNENSVWKTHLKESEALKDGDKSLKAQILYLIPDLPEKAYKSYFTTNKARAFIKQLFEVKDFEKNVGARP